MKYSTGRNARVKHSTATEEDYINSPRRHHRRPRPRYATGRDSTINHFTGIRFDLKREEERAQAEAEHRAAHEQAAGWAPPQPA